MSRRPIFSFLASSLFYWIALYVYVPSLPQYVQLRATNLAAVGVVLSMYGLWQGIARIPLGIAVDATGRGKPYLLVGFLLTAAGALVMGFGQSIHSLTLGRALTGLAAATWVPMIVVFTGFFPPEQAVYATSLLTLSSSFGMMIATTSTGFLNELGGYLLPFLLAGGFALLALLVSAATRAPRPVADKELTLSSVASIFGRRDVLIPSFVGAVVQLGNWAVIFGFMPILAKSIGASGTLTSLVVSVNVAAGTVGNLVNTLIIRRVEKRAVLLVSFAAFAAGIVLFAFAHGLGLFFAASSLMGLSSGFAYPTLMGLSIERVDRSHRTIAMGIHQAVYASGMFAGPWLGGIIADALGIRPMFVVTGLFCLIAGSALILLHPRAAVSAASNPDT